MKRFITLFTLTALLGGPAFGDSIFKTFPKGKYSHTREIYLDFVSDTQVHLYDERLSSRPQLTGDFECFRDFCEVSWNNGVNQRFDIQSSRGQIVARGTGRVYLGSRF